MEEYPGSAEAAEIMWDHASAADGQGDHATALREYGTLMERAPTLNRAGEARMRVGQIELGRGRREAAAKVYEAYLEAFPDGRRWEEAAFWAARARLLLGDTAAARRLVDRIRREEPVSYYAVMGARLLEEPYEMDLPPGPDPAMPEWLPEALSRLDALAASGLERGVEAEEDRLARRAGEDIGARLALAEALNERGRTIAGINLGWAMRGRWTKRGTVDS